MIKLSLFEQEFKNIVYTVKQQLPSGHFSLTHVALKTLPRTAELA